jgi:hypothetical protein
MLDTSGNIVHDGRWIFVIWVRVNGDHPTIFDFGLEHTPVRTVRMYVSGTHESPLVI